MMTRSLKLKASVINKQLFHSLWSVLLFSLTPIVIELISRLMGHGELFGGPLALANLYWRTYFIFLMIAFQATVIEFAFTCPRKYFEFGILNGISRKINFISNLIILVVYEVVVFSITMPLLYLALGQKLQLYLTSPLLLFFIFMLLILGLVSALQLSSFITLFEQKSWWLIIGGYYVISYSYKNLVQPYIMAILPQGFIHTLQILWFSPENSNESIQTLLGHYEIWLGLSFQICFALVLAAICQYYMQTQRLALKFRR